MKGLLQTSLSLSPAQLCKFDGYKAMLQAPQDDKCTTRQSSSSRPVIFSLLLIKAYSCSEVSVLIIFIVCVGVHSLFLQMVYKC